MMCFDTLCHELTRGPKRENCDKIRGRDWRDGATESCLFPHPSLALSLSLSSSPSLVPLKAVALKLKVQS